MWYLGMTLDQAERKIIEKVLRFYNGNKSATARSLGVSVKTIENKVKQYEQEATTGTNASQSRSFAS